MKFQRSTLILIVSALVLGGLVYVYEVEGRPQREAEKAKEKQIFPFEEKQVQSVSLTTKERTLLFERADRKPEDSAVAPKWLMTVVAPTQAIQPSEVPPQISAAQSISQSPTPSTTKTPEAKATEPPKETNLTKVPANEAYVAYLLDQMVKAKSDRIKAEPGVSYGLEQPQATVNVKLNNGKTHQLILGNPNFNRTSFYALADPPEPRKQPLQVFLVSSDFENSLNRPLSEWRQPEEKKLPPQEVKKNEPRSEQKPDKPATPNTPKNNNQAPEKPRS